MKTFANLLKEALVGVEEIFPWDLEEQLAEGRDVLILDIREPYEFNVMHIEDSINVPRGVLESAVEWDYEETEPELAVARDRNIVVVCRSGSRSLLAVATLKMMGFKNIVNLKTGLRGWNEYDLPLVDEAYQPITLEEGDAYLANKVLSEQRKPVDWVDFDH
ncbi:MAG: rhodanese-like domain-containing protein [Gammaproteobacteria bacterium]|nr:rhodanese-like domain-containing protein [Gammaproteobacteria bacterium]